MRTANFSVALRDSWCPPCCVFGSLVQKPQRSLYRATLALRRFLNPVINGDGKDSHPGNGFSDKPWQQGPPPAKNQEQGYSRSQIKRPLHWRSNSGPKCKEVRNRGHRKSKGQPCTRGPLRRSNRVCGRQDDCFIGLNCNASVDALEYR